jgi:hypothetical protein
MIPRADICLTQSSVAIRRRVSPKPAPTMRNASLPSKSHQAERFPISLPTNVQAGFGETGLHCGSFQRRRFVRRMNQWDFIVSGHYRNDSQTSVRRKTMIPQIAKGMAAT